MEMDAAYNDFIDHYFGRPEANADQLVPPAS
jgi:hypothetical protein